MGGNIGNLHLGKSKLTQTGYHMIPSGARLVSQGFQLMQDNDPKHTSELYQKYIKSKEEQHILQLISQTYIPLTWSGMNLTNKSQLNNLQVWLTSGNSCRKARQNYLQSLMERMQKICEAVIAAKGGDFDESKVEVFEIFSFNLYLTELRKTCILSLSLSLFPLFSLLFPPRHHIIVNVI